MLNLAHISSSEVHLRYNMTQSKRAREEDTTPAPTAVEAAKMVQDMTRTDMKALLSQLLKGSADVRAAVKRKHLAMQVLLHPLFGFMQYSTLLKPSTSLSLRFYVHWACCCFQANSWYIHTSCVCLCRQSQWT